MQTVMSCRQKMNDHTAVSEVSAIFFCLGKGGMRMACFHPIVLDTFHHPVEKTNFILDLIVSSHLATLTHSVMVSYLA